MSNKQLNRAYIMIKEFYVALIIIYYIINNYNNFIINDFP